MQRIKNGRLATQGLTAVLVFSTAFASSAAQVIQRRVPPPPASVAQLSPAAACATDNTPRIGNINGTQSGIVFQPGSRLNIVGCGFGNGGEAYLSAGIGVAVPLIVDTWNDSNIIKAHIDATIRGVSDIGVLNVRVKPKGAPELASAGSSSFHAARETALWALPPSLGQYSQVYGTPKVSVPSGGQSTLVVRDSRYGPFCPTVTDQEAQMQDTWQVGGGSLSFEQGFELDGVDYQNMTDQLQENNNGWESILVGKNGGANYDANTKTIVVTFQGHSKYIKRGGLVPDPGYSFCTSAYSVSLKLTGPRGISPFR